jgi:hypothetical protein
MTAEALEDRAQANLDQAARDLADIAAAIATGFITPPAGVDPGQYARELHHDLAGPPAGDQKLRDVAQILGLAVREEDGCPDAA